MRRVRRVSCRPAHPLRAPEGARHRGPARRVRRLPRPARRKPASAPGRRVLGRRRVHRAARRRARDPGAGLDRPPRPRAGGGRREARPARGADARAHRLRPALVGRHDAKLSLLAARGIETARVDRATREGFDVAVECTGNPEGFAVAQRAVRPRGTLVLKSTYTGALTLDASAVVVRELTLVGSRCGPFAPALRLLVEGRVAVEPLIQARYAL